MKIWVKVMSIWVGVDEDEGCGLSLEFFYFYFFGLGLNMEVMRIWRRMRESRERKKGV